MFISFTQEDLINNVYLNLNKMGKKKKRIKRTCMRDSLNSTLVQLKLTSYIFILMVKDNNRKVNKE